MEEHGIEYDPTLVTPHNIVNSGYEFGFHSMKNLLEKNKDMTAVVTMADVMAIGAAKAALMEGLRIPEDMSIIGFDGVEEAEYYNPALDTIMQPAQQMAQQTVDALMEMLRGGQSSHIVLEATLTRRGTCAERR